MISQLKILITVNWKEEGKWPLPHLLRNAVQRVDILQPVSLKSTVSSRLTYLSNYLSQFYLPFMAIFRKKSYDVIISWQMLIGICYGILNRIFHFRKPPVHIIQDFHIDLTQTKWLYRMKIALTNLGVQGIDYFFCTSTEEEKIYTQRFGIARSKIVFLPLTAPLSFFNEPDHPKKGYIFSYGNSDRDFDTLIRAVTPLNIKTYILSQRYQPHIPIPKDVSIIRDRISEKELIQWIASSRIAVIPLKDYRISAGQFGMLEVMALARPLIITENMATKEYAVHQQTALFYSAGNTKELAEQIQYLWDHEEAAEQIGQKARQAASKLNDKRWNIFINLLENCTMDIQKGERK